MTGKTVNVNIDAGELFMRLLKLHAESNKLLEQLSDKMSEIDYLFLEFTETARKEALRAAGEEVTQEHQEGMQ